MRLMCPPAFTDFAERSSVPMFATVAQAAGVSPVSRVLNPHIAASTEAFGVAAAHACGVAEAQIVSGAPFAEAAIVEHASPAVDDGANAVERLLTRLADVPTPAGPTPRQILTPPGPLLTIKPRRQP